MSILSIYRDFTSEFIYAVTVSPKVLGYLTGISVSALCFVGIFGGIGRYAYNYFNNMYHTYKKLHKFQ